MLKYRKLAANGGDYSFGRNADDFVTGELAVAQAVKTQLLLLQGEWFEDTSIGVPVFQHILGTSGSPDSRKAADKIIQNAILNVTGVKKIKDYSSTWDSGTRTYSVTAVVDTGFGDATVSVTY